MKSSARSELACFNVVFLDVRPMVQQQMSDIEMVFFQSQATMDDHGCDGQVYRGRLRVRAASERQHRVIKTKTVRVENRKSVTEVSATGWAGRGLGGGYAPSGSIGVWSVLK